jgi:hypothetical protein
MLAAKVKRFSSIFLMNFGALAVFVHIYFVRYEFSLYGLAFLVFGAGAMLLGAYLRGAFSR